MPREHPTPTGAPTIGVLFVCLGNICRSPAAEATFRALLRARGLAEHYRVDSAGTGGHHAGEPPHPGTLAEARRRGMPLQRRARQVTVDDLATFDLVVAMDTQNLRDLRRLARTPVERERLSLLRSYEPAAAELDVPDPWYTGEFSLVFDICERASRGLLAHVEAKRAPPR